MDIRDISDVLYLHRRRAIPAVVAVALAVITFVAFRSLVQGGDVAESPPPAPPPVAAETPPPVPEPEPAPPPAPAETEVPEAATEIWPTLLVSKQAIEAGDILGGEHLEWQKWREPIDLGTVILQNRGVANRVLGSIARQALPAGVPITSSGIVLRDGDRFISSMLAPAMRAVTVEVDSATTRAGLIDPGDRVDVILVSAVAEMQAQTIVRDVRVLAVGEASESDWQMGLGLDLGLGMAAQTMGLGNLGAVDEGLTSAPERGDTFTLEVSPGDADRLALAVNLGQITLALRGIAASGLDGAPFEAVGLADLLVVPENVALQPVRIIRGAGSPASSPSPTPASLFGS
ncbi:MAG: Flp pilus assembly protein CpaB [Gammaproteobacteria bacterium]|nr:Flp pilus assembly protein CpaB [Gammaproteobacteria bacterium]